MTPGKGGEWVDEKIPVFDSVKLAVEATGVNCTVIFVPARFAPDAMYEAADAGIPLIVCITEGVAIQDMMRVRNYLDQKKVRLLGPNCPGLLTPGECKVGIIPGDIAISGNVGCVSRSGTLTYEVLYALKLAGMGASTCVGIGGDPINGTNFIDVLEMFEHDPQTEKVVMIGALLPKPRALIVDEPMVGLDPASAKIVKGIFAQLAGEGTAILLSTHTLEVAEKLCHRIGILHHSRLIAQGTMEELRKKTTAGALDLESVFLELTGSANTDAEAVP